MKRILILFVLLIAPAFVFAQNNDWELVTSAGSKEFYYKRNTKNTSWVKTLKLDSKNDEYTITLYQFDCDDRKIGIVQSVEYKNGKVINSLNLKSYEVEMNYVVPETVGESLLESFCKD